MVVGGGFGVTPSAKKTFPAVALPLLLYRCRASRRLVHRHRQGAARFRQPVRPQNRPHEVPHSRLGLGTLPQQSRRVLRRIARAAAVARRLRLQRRHGLARTRRRAVVLRFECRERPDQRHGNDAAENRPARNLLDVPHAAAAHARIRASSSATSRPPIVRVSKKSCGGTTCPSPRTTQPFAAGRWPARLSPRAASPSPKANA